MDVHNYISLNTPVISQDFYFTNLPLPPNVLERRARKERSSMYCVQFSNVLFVGMLESL